MTPRDKAFILSQLETIKRQLRISGSRGSILMKIDEIIKMIKDN